MPAVKTVKTVRKHLTKKEKSVRASVEETLQGGALSPTPPEDLSPTQRGVYSWLYAETKDTGLLSSRDLVTVKNACIIIDRLNKIDKLIDGLDDPAEWGKYTTVRNTYFSQYLKICRELCLSPTARGRLGAAVANTPKDPLLEVLSGAQ